MRTQITRRTLQRLALTTAIAAFFAVSPLSAQGLRSSTQQADAPPQTPPPAAPQTTSQGPTVQLSIDQAVDMGLETSLGLKAERLNVDIASQSIASAKSAFVPTVSVGFTGNTAQRQPTDFTQGSSDISSHNMGGTGAFDQLLPWFGNRYHVGWNASRNTQIGGTSTFNPQLGSTLNFNVTQPLWRNFKIDQARGGVLSTEINRRISDVSLQQRVVSLEAQVRNAYLSYVGAIKGQEVAQQNMDIAQESLRAARARVAVGVGAPIEVIQAQAVAASFEEQLIDATSLISTTEDNLRFLILDHDRPDYWDVKIEPTSTILLTEHTVDLNDVVKTALANRLDAQIMRQQMQVTDLNHARERQLDASVARPHGGLHGDRHRRHAVQLRVGLSAAGVEPERSELRQRARRRVPRCVPELDVRRRLWLPARQIRSGGGRRAEPAPEAPAGAQPAAARDRHRAPGP